MNKFIIEVKWAVIFVLMSLLWMFIERLVGLHSTYIDKHPIYTNLVAIPAILIYVLALLDKRNHFYQGYMTYMQGFTSGVIISLIIMFISPLTQIITSYIITPEYFANAIENSVKAGKLSQPEAEKYFSLGNYIVQGLIGAPVMGIITTAIVAIFTRKTLKT